MAAEGARVVVNDIASAPDAGEPLAESVVREIEAAGGVAVANADDVSDWDGARRMVASAVETFGALDILVNNAGFVRTSDLASMTEHEWDLVVRVHLRGHAAPSGGPRSTGRLSPRQQCPVGPRSSTRRLCRFWGTVTSPVHYAAAKAGIAQLTATANWQLAEFGVRVNAIAPVARTPTTRDGQVYLVHGGYVGSSSRGTSSRPSTRTNPGRSRRSLVGCPSWTGTSPRSPEESRATDE